jgi:tetratricopeptide (TPR) repeat protein
MKTPLILATVLLSASSFAQTLQDAITKTDNERYDAAGSDFRSLISKEPTKGENYFYYGENFFRKDDLDSANMQYQKGSEVNATNPLNYVGLGKVLWVRGKDADAKAMFFKANSLSANKNAEVMRRIAEVYITSDNKNLDEAITLLNNAIKLEPKNENNHILLGDAYLEKNPTDGGPAIKEYHLASDLNPKSPKGMLREGKLYQRGRNYPLALDFYKKAEALDPTYAPAYREKAEIYHMAAQDPKAIEAYRKYLELNNSPDARERYATFLFNNKQYPEAVKELEDLQKKGNTNLYLNRYLGYSYYELGNKTDSLSYKKGLKAINDFFDKANTTPNFKILGSDYKYKGLLLSKNGQDSLGIMEMEKAAAMDPKIAGDMTTEVAKAYMKSKRYNKAIETFEKKMAGNPKNLTGQDYFDLGRAYFFTGQAKEKAKEKEEKDTKIKVKVEKGGAEDFVKADTAFSRLCQANPTYAVGYFWRGRVNAYLDPKDEKGLAKPHYEKYLSMIKPEERAQPSNKSNVIEANLYMGSHFAFNKTDKDMTKAKEFFNTVKEIDPNNKAANDFFKSPAASGK